MAHAPAHKSHSLLDGDGSRRALPPGQDPCELWKPCTAHASPYTPKSTLPCHCWAALLSPVPVLAPLISSPNPPPVPTLIFCHIAVQLSCSAPTDGHAQHSPVLSLCFISIFISISTSTTRYLHPRSAVATLEASESLSCRHSFLTHSIHFPCLLRSLDDTEFPPKLQPRLSSHTACADILPLSFDT